MWLAESYMLKNEVKKFYLNIDTFYLSRTSVYL